MAEPTDTEIIRRARPYLRSILAFIVYLRWGRDPKDKKYCYAEADVFIAQLESDMRPVTESPTFPCMSTKDHLNKCELPEGHGGLHKSGKKMWV